MLDDYEDAFIEQFRQHPVLSSITDLSEAHFHDILLQRRFISLAFTPAYDLAVDLLTDAKSIEIARVILREEYPDDRGAGRTPSHREDMRTDILNLGVSRAQLVASRPTKTTVDTIARTMAMLCDAGAAEHADVELLTILRFWGEVLVSVEYGELWRRMEPLLPRSVFYHPHHVHDAKSRPLATASPLSLTHSDQLGVRLSQLAESAGARQSFVRVEQAVLDIKNCFYDQFLHAVS